MIREYLKKRRTRKAFQELLDKNVVASVLKGNLNADVLQLKPAAMELIVAVVRGNTPKLVAERMGCVVDVAAKNNAMVLDMVSSMVIVAYGMFPQQHWGPIPHRQRPRLSQQQLWQLGFDLTRLAYLSLV